MVTEENYQTQYLRSANMTTKEVGREKKTNIENLEWGGVGWGGVGRTWEPGGKQSEQFLRQELKTNLIKGSRS